MAEEKPGEVHKGGGEKTAGVDALDSKTEQHHMIPVWFFVGILLLVYGVLIFIQGLAEWSHPPDTVLSNLHPPVWWGILLILLGAIFTVKHYPGRKRKA